ncbi:UPF0481 protein [Camellia lanceoleosa]|uniref:UPF0481 protein n=1 Tax=Camellia lanceoleosa TaxID=1840588 RepID=A0ACC0F8Y6_9ERIC|nr:UPF0481 protein [Camellia lanceoleosa]
MMRLTEAVGKKIDEGTHKTEFTSSASIYRVLDELRKLNKSAYTPRLVSVGPLHTPVGGQIELCEFPPPLLECLTQMRESLQEAKKCYAKEVYDKLDEEMLEIDGYFILELLYKFKHEECKKSSDPILGSILTAEYIRHDLLLLESQLPFFILQRLFKLTVSTVYESYSY